MAKFVITIAISCVKFVNLFFNFFGLRNKVTLISRQADEPTLDMRMLNDCLVENEVEVVMLAKKLNKSFVGMIRYSIHLLHQMYHIATSKVVVLDGYSILVSVLPKRKGQNIVQMWHAIGAIKKFGWQNIENPDGHSREVSEAMCMHRNYDYVLAPGKITGRIFAEAFRLPEDKLVYCGLPRIDYIRNNDFESKQAIQDMYNEVTLKPIVLYVPTFRKNAEIDLDRLVSGFDFENWNLIVKKHFLDKGDYSWAKEKGAIVDTAFSSLEWLKICDKVITDYSAIAFEAAILEKDIYIYQPDEEYYKHNVGINIDLKSEAIGEYVCRTEEALFYKLSIPYKKKRVIEFRKKYIEVNLNNCTQQLCDFIERLLTE